MIQTFSRRVLDGFSRLYGVVGSVARVNAIDVAPPVLVHDVSREAHVSGGFFAPTAVTVTTAGAGVPAFASQTRAAFLATAEVANMLQQSGLEATNVDTWIYHVAGNVTAATAADFSRLRAGVNLGTLSGSGAIYTLKRFTTIDNAIVSGGLQFLRTELGDNPCGHGHFTFPIFWPDDTTSALLAEAEDDTTGAIVTNALFHIWVGPKGCPPPVA